MRYIDKGKDSRATVVGLEIPFPIGRINPTATPHSVGGLAERGSRNWHYITITNYHIDPRVGIRRAGPKDPPFSFRCPRLRDKLHIRFRLGVYDFRDFNLPQLATTTLTSSHLLLLAL